MTTLTLELDSQTAQHLHLLQAQEGETAEQVATRILAHSLGTTPAFSSRAAKEIALLAAIRQELPTATWNRYRTLLRKLRKGALTAPEHEEWLTLRNRIEADHLARMERLIELSQLWNRPLKEVMAQLGVTPKRV
jgi:hypothetical protein